MWDLQRKSLRRQGIANRSPGLSSSGVLESKLKAQLTELRFSLKSVGGYHLCPCIPDPILDETALICDSSGITNGCQQLRPDRLDQVSHIKIVMEGYAGMLSGKRLAGLMADVLWNGTQD